jgi:hypothetical protein
MGGRKLMKEVRKGSKGGRKELKEEREEFEEGS